MTEPAERLVPEAGLGANGGAAVDVNLGVNLLLGRTHGEAGAPKPLGQLQSLSPAALAYLGDAVFELFVRAALLLPPQRLQTYHQQVVEQVRAERQVQHLEALMPRLTQPEVDIFKRGRNASPRGPRRLKPAVYQQATGFETLIGHLYIHNPARLMELLGYVDLTSP